MARSAIFLTLGMQLVAGSSSILEVDGVANRRSMQIPGRAGLLPFEQIAEEITEAERLALDLQWQVGNSSSEKESVQWFMATAMKELTKLKKEVLDPKKTEPPSLANKYEACYDKTVANMPAYDDSMSLGENLEKDSSLAPDALEAHMYDVYEAEFKLDELTRELGECGARCPMASLLSKSRVNARKSIPTDPRKLMTHIADAIYNNSESIHHMEDHLDKDRAAMDVLESVTATVMKKLLKAKRDVETMEFELDDCLKVPAASKVNSEVRDAMAHDPGFSEELLAVATNKAAEVKKEVKELQKKVDACHRECGLR